jgi:hypothetical protein
MSNRKYTVIHRADPNNVGDLASNPLQYFLKPDEYKVVDLLELGKTSVDEQLPIIVGGGGLIANEFLLPYIQKLQTNTDVLQLRRLFDDRWQLGSSLNERTHTEFTDEYRQLIKKYIDKIDKKSNKRIMWGAGHNADTHKDKKGNVFIDYPDWLVDYDLVGLRDNNVDYNWAPCASCMHPELRKNHQIKNDVIWFEHKKQLIKDFGNESIPRFINSGSNISQTIELLGSANIILTNSYHGAYWGTLMRKRVIVVGSWSSKFYTLRHSPYILEKGEDWKDALEKVERYPAALDECASATEKFWQKVQAL